MIILYGGSFDPLHNGHLSVVVTALNAIQPDRLILIPTHCSPLKDPPLLEDKQRVAFLEGIRSICPKCEVSTIELSREGPSYTIDTIRAFQTQFPEESLGLLIGDDQLWQLKKWKSYKEILSEVQVFVVNRLYSKSEISDYIIAHFEAYHRQINFLSMRPNAASSTKIKANLAKNRSVGSYVPSWVQKGLR